MRKRIFYSILSSLVIFLLIASHGVAQGPAAEDRKDPKGQAFSHIAAAAEGLATVASDFVQERHISMLKEPIVSQGRFFYEKPDRIYWEVTRPSPSGFAVAEGKGRRWEGDPAKAETFSLRKDPVAKAIVEQVLAWTRADFPWLEKRYKITVTENRPNLLRLAPLSSQEKKYVSHIVVGFSKDWSYVASVDIYESGGDSIRIRFSHTVLNEPVPGDLFRSQ